MARRKLRAVFYARVSTEEEKQLNALEKQIQENRDVIKENGWELVGEYIDEGKSGTTTKRRSDYKKLLEDMELDIFDIVVVKDQERLQRNTLDWYLFINRLVLNNQQLYFYLDKKFYSADDTLITGIKAILAEEYSRNLSKKLNNANRRRVEKAKESGEVSAMGNGKSLGYAIHEGKWVQIPEEIKVCNIIWDLYEKYDSIRITRDEINSRGYKNSVGKPFTSESISRILKNEKAKGVIVLGRYHHDFDLKKIVQMPEEEWVRVPAPELAYVSEERFNKVQERLKAKTVEGRGKKVGRDPLSGKLFCGKCGGVLWRRESVNKLKSGEKKKYYSWRCSQKFAKGDIVCTGVGDITTIKIKDIYTNLSKDLVVNRDVVKSSMVDWLKSLRESLISQRDNKHTLSEIKRLEGQKNRLTEAYIDEIISKADYKIKYKEIENKLAELNLLVSPVEDNEDIKDIEKTLANIDEEIDKYIGAPEFEDSKIEWLIDHTKKITVLEDKRLILEMDMLAGAIIAGKDFMLFVHSSMQFTKQITDYVIEIKLAG